MRVLDLFSGIGGFSLGLERAGMKTVAFCEIDPFCRQVLRKHWSDVPIHEDIRSLDGRDYAGSAELVCGGYPCQPFSHAGKRRGAEDDRHLWPEMRRIIEQARPAWVIGENVAGHISLGLDEVLSDMESLGYTARSFVIPAVAVGARHIRQRVWVVAMDSLRFSSDSCGIGLKGERARGVPGCEKGNETGSSTGRSDKEGSSNTVRDILKAPSWSPGRMGREEPVSGNGDWEIASQPFVRRGTHGIPNRMDRLRSLGNAVVPQVAEMIGRAIMATAP